MTMLREIKKLVRGTVQIDGAGVKLIRVLGGSDVADFDPFLMLDAFDSHDAADYCKGFPWHPHRGIETVTYLIHGAIEHMDSLGNKGVIRDGCCQWMTAGSGIMHQEMPLASEHMLGVQLWLNLPRRDKMTKPEYRDIEAAMVPVVYEQEACVKVIAGRYQGTSGATQGDYVPALLLDVSMKNGMTWSLDEAGKTLFVYLVSGNCCFGSAVKIIEEKQAVLFGEGERLQISAASDCRLLVFAGNPLREPVAWGGPIVMNTREELRTAFAEIEQGTFIKEKATGIAGDD